MGTTAALQQARQEQKQLPHTVPTAEHLLLSEQLRPKACPSDTAPPVSSHRDIRARVSQQVPKGRELQTALGHRDEGCFGYVGWYLVFQLPISEKSQLMLPLQVVPIQVPKINLPREHSVKTAPKSHT